MNIIVGKCTSNKWRADDDDLFYREIIQFDKHYNLKTSLKSAYRSFSSLARQTDLTRHA